ncbi:unnamed protein product [Phytomonas sp. EM1]|nr:unnamed protein product [Phytomonas sp. EM1]|eukprot:CCW63350.1 unnamed protein product [Phytomonas sp. isolate EM1]
MSYNIRRLRFFVDDVYGSLQENQTVAEQFFLSEDDHELEEMMCMMVPYAHYSSFWGVARDELATKAVHTQEKEYLRLSWTGGITPLTSSTFIRAGYAHLTKGSFLSDLPIVGPALSMLFQERVIESLVVRNGKIVFRDLGYNWRLGVH